jgi:anionic cell wall polymer biosynthesis LytR-Cps2A-Psr (LCP) family protein
MRLNAIATSGRGAEATFAFFTDTWKLPLEGYIVTGFAGFADIVDAVFGRLAVTIPIPIPTQPWYPGFRAGDHELSGERTLEFSRTRKGVPGGDFTRSFHHGVVMLAALQTLQDASIHALPPAIAELSRHAVTDLSATDLIQLGAIALDLDIGRITNEVLPGSLGRTTGGASVVFLEDGYETIVADVLDDGVRSRFPGGE